MELEGLERHLFSLRNSLSHLECRAEKIVGRGEARGWAGPVGAGLGGAGTSSFTLGAVATPEEQTQVSLGLLITPTPSGDLGHSVPIWLEPKVWGVVGGVILSYNTQKTFLKSPLKTPLSPCLLVLVGTSSKKG